MMPGVCKHFTGFQKPPCKKGVDYRSHVGGEEFGWAARLPCVKKTKTDSIGRDCVQVPCSLYEEPTKEELEAFEKEMNEYTSQAMAALVLIGLAKGNTGEVECPRCKKRLRFSKHKKAVQGQCETKGCLGFMT